MAEMVEARRNADKVEERYDLFSGLLDAAQDEQAGEGALSNEELIGGYIDVGIVQHSWKASYPPFQETCLSFFLLDMRYDLPPLPAVLPQNGSLQTTAHTLCFTFALLALYPDEQERLYQHIKGVMSSLNGMPVGSSNLDSYRELTSL
jgi:cytochrome P450